MTFTPLLLVRPPASQSSTPLPTCCPWAKRPTIPAHSTPEPTVEWLHNGRPLERNGTDDKSEAWVERGFLFVRGGRYGVNTVCCMASNSAGTANHSAELLVFGKS
ncbi:unnamed protein product [Arctogadus glacialis]